MSKHWAWEIPPKRDVSQALFFVPAGRTRYVLPATNGRDMVQVSIPEVAFVAVAGLQSPKKVQDNREECMEASRLAQREGLVPVVSAIDRTASFLDMDLTDFISGLDGFEWKPEGRHMKFSQELYSSIPGTKAATRPALISLQNAADGLGISLEEFIDRCSVPDDGIRKTRVSFGPLPMRTVAVLYSACGGWDISLIKLNEVLDAISMSYDDFLSLADSDEIEVRPSIGDIHRFTRDDITAVIRTAYRDDGISISKAAYILDTDANHVRKLLHRDGLRTIALSTISRLAYPLGWDIAEVFRNVADRK